MIKHYIVKQGRVRPSVAKIIKIISSKYTNQHSGHTDGRSGFATRNILLNNFALFVPI